MNLSIENREDNYVHNAPAAIAIELEIRVLFPLNFLSNCNNDQQLYFDICNFCKLGLWVKQLQPLKNRLRAA